MIKQKCIPLESPVEWKKALSGIKHVFAHTWENCRAMNLTTGFNTHLYCFATEGIRIVCPIAEREFQGYVDIVTPYGFSGFAGTGPCPEFSHYWREFVQQRGYICGYIALNPIFEPNGYFGSNEIYHCNSLYFLDLTLSTHQLFANLDSNRKRQLKDFDKTSFVLDKRVLADFCIAIYPEFLRRVQASPATHFTENTLRFLFSLPNVFMVGAGKPQELEAVSVFTYTPFAGDFLFNIATREGRRHATPLLWCGANYLKLKDVPVFNLGGGVRENDNVARSKERFGPTKLPFRALKQVYNRSVYEKLCREVGVDPADRTGYFPGYRSSHSPP
jgi:hypothetical protein